MFVNLFLLFLLSTSLISGTEDCSVIPGDLILGTIWSVWIRWIRTAQSSVGTSFKMFELDFCVPICSVCYAVLIVMTLSTYVMSRIW